MKINKKMLKMNESLFNKLKNTCNYCNVKLEVIYGINKDKM